MPSFHPFHLTNAETKSLVDKLAILKQAGAAKARIERRKESTVLTVSASVERPSDFVSITGQSRLVVSSPYTDDTIIAEADIKLLTEKLKKSKQDGCCTITVSGATLDVDDSSMLCEYIGHRYGLSDDVMTFDRNMHITTDDFAKAVSYVSPAAMLFKKPDGNERKFSFKHCIRFEIGITSTVIATDAIALSTFNLNVQSNDEFAFELPKMTCDFLLKLFSFKKNEGVLDVGINDTHLRFVANDVVFTVRLYRGERSYPDWRRVVPELTDESASRLQISKSVFLDKIKSFKDVDDIIFDLSDKETKILATDGAYKYDVFISELIDGTFSGTDAMSAVNRKRLISAVEAFDTDDIVISFTIRDRHYNVLVISSPSATERNTVLMGTYSEYVVNATQKSTKS